jgi:hypothetical protein
MMLAKDWMQEAAIEVETEAQNDFLEAGDIRDIIAKHCPFEVGVAYMPVPRCDTCKHWRKSDNYYGSCAMDDGLGVRTTYAADFGCVLWEAK